MYRTLSLMDYNTEKCVFNYQMYIYIYIFIQTSTIFLQSLKELRSIKSECDVYHLTQQIYILYYSLHIYMNYDNGAHTRQYFNPSSFNRHLYTTHKTCCYGFHMHQPFILMRKYTSVLMHTFSCTSPC